MSRWVLNAGELALAKSAKELPADASWATGDDEFDARVRKGLLERDSLRAEVERLRARGEALAKALDDAEDALLQCIVDMNDTHPRTGTLDGLRRALSISTDAASEQLKAIRAALAEWEKP